MFQELCLSAGEKAIEKKKRADLDPSFNIRGVFRQILLHFADSENKIHAIFLFSLFQLLKFRECEKNDSDWNAALTRPLYARAEAQSAAGRNLTPEVSGARRRPYNDAAVCLEQEDICAVFFSHFLKEVQAVCTSSVRERR